VNPITTVPHGQRGMTTIGIILVLAMIGFFATLVIRLTPVYLESFQISSIFKSLEKEVPMASASNEEIRSSLAKRFDINSINDVKPRQVHIERKDGRVTGLSLKYDAQVPLFANIDAVVHFKKAVEVGH